MANVVYNSAKEQFLIAGIDLSSVALRAVLIDTGVTTFDAADDFYDDISAGVVGTESGLFGSKTTTAGVFDAADITFTAVTGATVEAIVIFEDTGNVTTDSLIAWIDTATGLPVTPNGGDITVAWDSGGGGIFSL